MKVTSTLTLGLMALVLAACLEDEPQTEIAPPERPIAWMTVTSSSLEQVRRISGTLQAAESADLSFEVGGKVERVNVKLGDRVTAGDVLAELDESSYQLNTTASQGQLREANASLDEAQSNFRRQSQLHKDGWISAAALDNARAALDRARSTVQTAQAQLNLSQKDLGDTALKAPYDGVITSRQVEPSQTVTAGQTILEIEGAEGLEVSVMTPETLIRNIQRDEIFDVTFPALPDIQGRARVTEIGVRVETANAFPMTLLLENESPALRAGMSAEVDFVFEGQGRTGFTGEAVRVPPTALLAGEGEISYVFVFNPDEGVVNRRAVQTENILNNEVMVSSGLEDGEIIAVAGVPYLHDNQKVTLLGVGPERFN